MEFLNFGWQTLVSIISALIWVNYQLLKSAVKSREDSILSAVKSKYDGILKDIERVKLEIKEEIRKETLFEIEKHCRHLENNISMKIDFIITKKNLSDKNNRHENV